MMNIFKDSDVSIFTKMGWCPSTEEKLLQSESTLLKGVKCPFEGEFVEIGPVICPKGDRVFTYRTNLSSPNTPIVLIHGFGAGSALWCANIDGLCKDRPLYTMDLIGFGRSSRPKFSEDITKIEEEFVQSIEAWRKVVGLKKFYLLGHSFGAYISTLYAMKHPHRVEHLIVADPWGFADRKKNVKLPVWGWPIQIGAAVVNPFTFLRITGPLGYMYLQALPPFPTKNFPAHFDKPSQWTAAYFYHLNMREPQGEKAFHRMMAGVGWAKRPMIKRIRALRDEVPMTFIYGENTWMFKSPGIRIKHIRKNAYVDVHYIADAGHNVFLDQPDKFNSLVSETLLKLDSGDLPTNPLTKSADSISSDVTGSQYLPPSESWAASTKAIPETILQYSFSWFTQKENEDSDEDIDPSLLESFNEETELNSLAGKMNPAMLLSIIDTMRKFSLS